MSFCPLSLVTHGLTVLAGIDMLGCVALVVHETVSSITYGLTSFCRSCTGSPRVCRILLVFCAGLYQTVYGRCTVGGPRRYCTD